MKMLVDRQTSISIPQIKPRGNFRYDKWQNTKKSWCTKNNKQARALGVMHRLESNLKELSKYKTFGGLREEDKVEQSLKQETKDIIEELFKVPGVERTLRDDEVFKELKNWEKSQEQNQSYVSTPLKSIENKQQKMWELAQKKVRNV